MYNMIYTSHRELTHIQRREFAHIIAVRRREEKHLKLFPPKSAKAKGGGKS